MGDTAFTIADIRSSNEDVQNIRIVEERITSMGGSDELESRHQAKVGVSSYARPRLVELIKKLLIGLVPRFPKLIRRPEGRRKS